MEENNIYLEFPSLPKNESLAKMLVAEEKAKEANE